MTEARIPTRQTLRKYGLSVEEWRDILVTQDGGCGVCGKVPASGTLHIEHEHVRGWAKMAPEEKKQYVRGLACWFCNTNLLRIGTSPARLRAAADYLERYAERRRIA